MFKKLQQLLEAGKLSQELAEEIDGEISTSLKSLRDENASWRVKYNDLNKNYEAISQTKEDLESKLSSFDDAIKKAKEEGKSELVKELESLRQETQKLQENLASIEAQNKALKVENALSAELGKYEVIDADVLTSVLKSAVVLDKDSLKFKDGDALLALEDGIKMFFEKKPHLLKPKGNSGSGAGNGVNGGNGKSFKDMSVTERAILYKENPEEYKKLKGS